MKTARYLLMLATFCELSTLRPAYALCLDPDTRKSGYVVPLDKEVLASEMIVTGKVLTVKPQQEDHDDPTGVTAYLYSIRVLRQFKGRLPVIFSLKIETDSGSYPLRQGESHLLFIRSDDHRLTVNGCGHSSVLPQGVSVLRRVEKILQSTRNTF